MPTAQAVYVVCGKDGSRYERHSPRPRVRRFVLDEHERLRAYVGCKRCPAILQTRPLPRTARLEAIRLTLLASKALAREREARAS